MRRQNLALFAVSVILIVGAILAGVIFVPEINALDESQNAYLQPVETHGLPPIQTEVPEFHIVDSPTGEAFFLKLAASPQDIQIGYQLVAAPLDGNFFAGEVPFDAQHCSNAGTPVAGINLEARPVKHPATTWEALSGWASLPVYDPFVISMWVPSSQVDEYTLVEFDETWPYENCAGLPGEGV